MCHTELCLRNSSVGQRRIPTYTFGSLLFLEPWWPQWWDTSLHRYTPALSAPSCTGELLDMGATLKPGGSRAPYSLALFLIVIQDMNCQPLVYASPSPRRAFKCISCSAEGTCWLQWMWLSFNHCQGQTWKSASMSAACNNQLGWAEMNALAEN